MTLVVRHARGLASATKGAERRARSSTIRHDGADSRSHEPVSPATRPPRGEALGGRGERAGHGRPAGASRRLVAAVVAGGGFARVFGSAGLVAIALFAASRAVRRYRAGAPAAIPAAVGRAPVRARPRRIFSAVTIALALGLPLALAVAGLVLVEWAWVVVLGVLLLGCAGTFVAWVANAGDYEYPSRPSEVASELLRAPVHRRGHAGAAARRRARRRGERVDHGRPHPRHDAGARPARRRRARGGARARARPPRPPRRRGDGRLLGAEPRPARVRADRHAAVELGAGLHGLRPARRRHRRRDPLGARGPARVRARLGVPPLRPRPLPGARALGRRGRGGADRRARAPSPRRC